MRGSLARTSLFPSFVLAVVALSVPRPGAGGETTPAALFGVDVGTPLGTLRAEVEGALECREHGAPASVLACRGGLGLASRFPPQSTSYWIAADRVARIYAVSHLTGRAFSECTRALAERVAEVASLLGQPPSEPAAEPLWMQALDDEAKLVELIRGRAGLRALWRLGERELTVGLYAEQGVPALVVGLTGRNAPASTCGPDKLAGLLMGLFASGPTAGRVAAAEGLAACRTAGAAGALAAAARGSEEATVRVAAVHALAALGPAGVTELRAIAKAGKSPEPAALARSLLAEAGKPARLASKPHLPPPPAGAVTSLTLAPARTPAETPSAGLSVAPRAPAPGAPADAMEPEPAQEAVPPAAPERPRDGAGLALATALVAGGVWGGGLSLLAQQSSPGVLALVGSAGAVIGGGTAWGLTHFGWRPTPSQALWFANSTAWGTLAGLSAWAASGSESTKLKWGLLVGGESLGMAVGVLGARRWEWTTSQVLFANSLVLGAGFAGGGGRMLARPGEELRISPLVGYGAAPAMLASAALSRYAQVSRHDLHLLGATAAASAWTAGLVSLGLDADPATREHRGAGGFMLGLGAGYLGAAALSPFVEIAPRRAWLSGAGLLAGNLVGTGMHMMLFPGDGTRRPLWAGLGGLALGATTFAAYPRLRLGGQAAGMSLAGAVYGAGTWALAMAASEHDSTARRQGGALALGTAGGLAGLLASGAFDPGLASYPVTLGAAALGAMTGIGVGKLATRQTGTGELAGTLAGSAVGLAGGIVFTHGARLRAPDFGAAALGGGYGTLVGALAPTLFDAEWGGGKRSEQAGVLLGLPVGTVTGAALSHLAGAEGGTVRAAAAGSALGLGLGLGTGLLWPEGYSRPARLGAVAGASTGLAAALWLERPLGLRDGAGPAWPGLAALGASVGVAEGMLLAALVDPSGEVSRTSARQLAGGALLGGSTGLASGLLLSRRLAPGRAALGVTAGGALFGGLFGRGLMMSASPAGGRRDTAATMAGGLAGTAGLALVEGLAPLGESDLAAGALGLAYGGLVGALAPTLADASWGGWRRRTEGGLLAGVGGGALAAAGFAHATGTTTRTLGWGVVGALQGGVAGAGIGLLADAEATSTRGARVGLVAGASGGLLLGLGLWPRFELAADDGLFISAATAVGGFAGGWSQVLGHARLDDVRGRGVRAGVMAGAGGASLLATALAPALRVDRDLLGNALVAGVLFGGAGAGVGGLASRRADAPVWGMLGAGAGGLLLGGALHGSIDLRDGAGLLTFGALEGLWVGGWLPYVLRPSSEVSSSERLAGLAAGGLGGAGLSLLASTVVAPRPASLGMAGAGSALGAALAGGSVLLAEELHDQRGIGIMLGGTAAGLGLGGLASRWLPLDGDRGLRMLGGAGFGLAEGLAFAWAGRASTSRDYAGSALIGAGVGASLGLASSADATGLDRQQALVASGFAAWGGWIGSFGGALANRDSHEVVLGGLAAANFGFAAGYGALRYDLVEPRDFGWLSLAGAMGAALGGGVGAAFSSRSDPRPVLAGLALGPLLGIGTGAFVVPHLRRPAEPDSALFRAPRVAGVRFTLSPPSEGRQRDSSDVLAERKPSRVLAGLRLARRHLFDVTNWTPVVGSLPPLPGDPNPAPFFVGLSGGLR